MDGFTPCPGLGKVFPRRPSPKRKIAASGSLQLRMPRTLAQWLEYVEQQPPKSVALGLERMRAVAQRMGLQRPARKTSEEHTAELQSLIPNPYAVSCVTHRHTHDHNKQPTLEDIINATNA